MSNRMHVHNLDFPQLSFNLCELMNLGDNYVHFMEDSADMVFVLDQNENILFINRHGYELLEYEYGSLQNQNFINTLVPVTNLEEVRNYLKSLFCSSGSEQIDFYHLNKTKVNHHYENYLQTQSGYKLMFSFKIFALSNELGIVEVLFCLGTNVTSYRKIERELSYSLSKYKALFEHFPLGITLADSSGKIIETNAMSSEILGLNSDEHCSRSIHGEVWKIVNRDMEPMADSDFASVRALKEHRSMFNQEMGFVKADSSIAWLSVNASIISHPEASVLITYSDITSKIHLENLLIAREKLRQFAASSKNSLHDLLQKLLDEAELLTNSVIGFAHFLEADQETLVLQTWSTNTLKHMCKINNSGQHYAVKDAGVWVECIHTKSPVIHNDYANMANKKGLPDGHAPVNREMVVPIIRSGKIVAIIGLGNKPSNYTENDLNAVIQLSDLVWDIIWQKKSDQALEDLTHELQGALAREKHAANTDFLTGTFNRRSLLDALTLQIKMSIRYHEPLSLLLFDLDLFKSFNDQYGHLIGDEVLKHVTYTVHHTLRDSDILGRFGGEEFIIILPKTHGDEALILAERIRNHVELHPFNDASQTYKATISIGVATYIPGETIEQLISRADDAM